MSRRLAACVALLAACAPAPEPSEPARWLGGYLRFDTSGPPGDERPAVDYLAGLLEREGIAAEVLATPGGRASLFAAVGPQDAETLLLLHHVDVVPPGEGWTVEPFGAVVRDGAIWGRGAIDAKGLGVTHLAALVALARSGAPLTRRVALLAAAGEESGGLEGTAWWLERRPDLFAGVTGVLGEGGFNRAAQGHVAWWGVEVAQKRPLWIEACAADAGALVRGLARLVDRPPEWRVTAPARAFFLALGEAGFDPAAVIRPDGPTRRLLPGMQNFFLDSLQVNGLELKDGGACATIDARLLPDRDPEEALAGLAADLGSQVTVSVLLAGPASDPSPVDHPLFRLVARQLGPEGPVVPYFIAGITDARFFRARGVAAYGLSPFVLDPELSRSVHAANERLPLAELDAAAERMRRLVQAWAAGDAPHG